MGRFAKRFATNRYETKPKTEAREFVIGVAKKHNPNIETVITLPSEKAICAKRFKEEFGARVTGVDLGLEVVRFYDGDDVDEYYQGNILNLGKREFRKPIWAKGLDDCNIRKLTDKVVLGGRFDLAYIDLTSLIGDLPKDKKPPKLPDLRRIVDIHTGSVAAITFMRRKDNFSIDEEEEYLDAISSAPRKVLRYTNMHNNKVSEMLVAVYLK